jgi:hypothetical protein
MKPALYEVPQPLQLCLFAQADADWSKDWDSVSVSGNQLSIHFPAEINQFKKTFIPPKFNLLQWSATKQADHVADSTESAETYSCNTMCNHIEWGRNLLEELQILYPTPTYLANDNQSNIINIKEGRVTAKARHNARKFANVRKQSRQKKVDLVYVTSEELVPDWYTKVVDNTTNKRHRASTMDEANIGKRKKARLSSQPGNTH